MKVLFDTNILIDYLLGHVAASRELSNIIMLRLA
jgi:predicted nucleic acid-binding protein